MENLLFLFYSAFEEELSLEEALLYCTYRLEQQYRNVISFFGEKVISRACPVDEFKVETSNKKFVVKKRRYRVYNRDHFIMHLWACMTLHDESLNSS